MTPIRVLIADDQAMVREGLSVLLNAQPDIQVAGQAADGQEAVRKVGEVRPDAWC
jgi:DNA-binding NarL/FixJ family response regulator